MKNFMNSVKIDDQNYNYFDLSHDVKTSFQMGYLIPSPPILCSPGDHFKLGAKSLIRFAPLAAPVMHRFDVRHEYFFVPFRLLWADYDKYFALPGTGETPPIFPYVRVEDTMAQPTPGLGVYPLLNYMGIPFRMTGTEHENVSAMPMAAYQLIYDEYYRDQNLITQQVNSFTLVNGDNSANTSLLFQLRKRAWERDYFTSALPEAQKGDPVMIPIGSQNVILDPTSALNPRFVQPATTTPVVGAVTGAAVTGILNVGGNLAQFDPAGTLITEDSGEATSINDLRLAYALQRLKERLMRGGSRLTEMLRVVYGVFPEDMRIQRPEYIGGVKSPVVISEVLSTAETTELPQGNMGGHGVAVTQGEYSTYDVKEHGYILCITSVIPRTAYQNAMDRHWFKIDDPYDYFYPDLAHIGEQAIQKREIFPFQGATGTDEFGYTPRYSEYKVMRSYATGEFQTTLDHWTAARQFNSAPSLNQQFIECDPDTRIFAVEDGVDHIYAHIYHDINVRRKMPKFGTPSR